MNITDFLYILLSNSVMIPAAVLCLAPMKDQLKYSLRSIVVGMAVVFVITIPAASYLQLLFSLNANTILIPLVIIFFAAYHLCLKVHISKSVAVFAYVCALLSVFENTANGLDALVNPTAGAVIVTHESAVFQFALCTAGAAAMFYPLFRYGSFLIDNLDFDRIWYVTVLISGTILGVNVSMTPQSYQTLYTNNVFRVFWTLQALFLMLEIVLGVIFYYIVDGLLTSAKNETRRRFLEMQESSYRRQQKYIEDTARARHDFKQTVRMLTTLAVENDIDGIKEYLLKYSDTLPGNDMHHYCKNIAVNALLNHYAFMAENSGISINWEIDLPDGISISDTDLCITIGNILDNAMTACTEAEERYIKLTVRLHNDSSLYIIAVNSFGGKLKQKGDRYISTHRNGSGIGLSSVTAIAEKNGGTAHFHHNGNEFFSEVVMNVSP